jgi:hypothetical protein
MAFALRRRASGFMRRPRVARARTRLVHVGRRVASRAGAASKHRMVALGAAAVTGFAKGKGIEIPHIDKLGVEGTYGAALFLWATTGKAPAWADHAATGLLAVAVHEAMQEVGGDTSGDFDAGALDFDDQDLAAG